MQDEYESEAPQNAVSIPALGAAIAAALVGAVAWWAIAHFAHYEIGWIAWGIGGLIGFAAVSMGGRGAVMGACCALLAILSLAIGKYASTASTLSEMQTEVEASLAGTNTADVYDEMARDAAAWGEMDTEATDAEVRAFMVAQSFAEDAESLTEEDVESFRMDTAPGLAKFAENTPDFAKWKADRSAEVTAYVSEITSPATVIGAVKDDLGPMDLLFAALGIMTAWGMVTKAD